MRFLERITSEMKLSENAQQHIVMLSFMVTTLIVSIFILSHRMIIISTQYFSPMMSHILPDLLKQMKMDENGKVAILQQKG